MGLFRRKVQAPPVSVPIPADWVEIVNGLLRVRDWLDPDVLRMSDGTLVLWVKASPITGLMVGPRSGKWWIMPAGYGARREPAPFGSAPTPVCHEDSTPDQVVQAILLDVGKCLFACAASCAGGGGVPKEQGLWAATELQAFEEAGLVPALQLDLDE